MVQWLGSHALTVVAGVRFPVAECFFESYNRAYMDLLFILVIICPWFIIFIIWVILSYIDFAWPYVSRIQCSIARLKKVMHGYLDSRALYVNVFKKYLLETQYTTVKTRNLLVTRLIYFNSLHILWYAYCVNPNG